METKKKPWVKPELKPLDGNIESGGKVAEAEDATYQPFS